jgi:urease accessory protein
MLPVRGAIGSADEPRFAGRRVECLRVTWHEASKRRLRRSTDAGTDVAVALERDAYLADGDVLDDDGARIVVVRRPAERAVVVCIDPQASRAARLRAAVLLGHVFGNQHVPVEVEGDEIRVPVTTSESIALDTVAALELPGVAARIEMVALAAQRPLLGAGARHHHHDP